MKFRRSERRRAPARTRIAGSRTLPDSQSANLKPQRSDAIEFALKTAVAGFIRRHKLMEFEKSRLAAQVEQPAGADTNHIGVP